MSVLVGATGIAEMLGVSRQRVHELRKRSDWPLPLEVIGGRPVWATEDVKGWIAEHQERRREARRVVVQAMTARSFDEPL